MVKKTKTKLNVIITNKTTNETISYKCLAIKQKNKISYKYDDILNYIEISDKKVIIKRSSHNYKNVMDLNLENSISTIIIPEGKINLPIKTNLIINKENYLKVNYIIEDTKEEYEVIIEMSE